MGGVHIACRRSGKATDRGKRGCRRGRRPRHHKCLSQPRHETARRLHRGSRPERPARQHAGADRPCTWPRQWNDHPRGGPSRTRCLFPQDNRKRRCDHEKGDTEIEMESTQGFFTSRYWLKNATMALALAGPTMAARLSKGWILTSLTLPKRMRRFCAVFSPMPGMSVSCVRKVLRLRLSR